MPIDAKQLAAIRKLISQDDRASVDQGLALATGLANPEIWQLLATGVSTDLQFDRESEVWIRVKDGHRRWVGLHALRATGQLDAVADMRLSINELPVVAGLSLRSLTIFRGEGSLTPLLQLPSLTILELKNCQPSDCEVLASLPLTSVRLEELRDHFSPDLLPAVARVPTLTELRIKNCHLGSLDALAACPALVDLAIVFHEWSTIGSIAALAGIATLRRLDAKMSYSYERRDDHGKLDLTSLGALTQLEELHLDGEGKYGQLPSMAWLGRLTRLRALVVAGLNAADWAPLAALTQLETLTIKEGDSSDWRALEALTRLVSLEIQPTDVDPLPHAAKLPRLQRLVVSPPMGYGRVTATWSLAPLRDHPTLAEVCVPSASEAATLLSLPALQKVHSHSGEMACDLDVAALRSLVAKPTLTNCRVVGPLLPSMLDRQRDDTPADLVQRLAPARSLPAAVAVAEPTLKEAKKSLKAGFKAAKTPAAAVAAMLATPLAELRALGFDATLSDFAQLTVTIPAETLGLRATHEADVALAFADRAGLLDGAGVLSFRDQTHLASLSPLKRHADTLAYVDLRGSRQFGPSGWTGAYSGDGLAQLLDQAEPMPRAVEARNTAPMPEALLALLRGDDAAVAQGVAQAVALGRVEDLLMGCKVAPLDNGQLEVTLNDVWTLPCKDCRGSGRRGAGTCGTCEGKGTLVTDFGPQRRGLLAALAVAPAGDGTARKVVAHMQTLNRGWQDRLGAKAQPGDGLLHGAWLQHADQLGDLTLPWDRLAPLLPALAQLPKLARLALTGVSGDLSCLNSLRQVRHLVLEGTLALAGLTGHPGLVSLQVDGDLTGTEALAQIATLRGLASKSAVVGPLCAALAPRLPVRVGTELAPDVFTLSNGW